MKKYSWYCIVFTVLSVCAVAQELPFALQNAQQPLRAISGSFDAYNIKDVLVDAAGNTYIAGYINGTIDFDPGPATLSIANQSPGQYDAFVAKYTAQGNLVFAKTIQGPADKEAYSLAILPGGKILIAGYYTATANFDPGVSDFSLTANGGTDAFYARYDANTGNFEFAAGLGGVGNDVVFQLVVAPNADGYGVGYFDGTVDFDLGAGAVERTASAGFERFIVKYDASLALQWVHAFPSLTPQSIALDASGLYVTGGFSVAADMDPGPATLTKSPAGNNDIWLSKFDLNGALLWNNVMGGTNYDFSNDVAVDVDGNVTIVGEFEQTVDFDPGAGTQNQTVNGNRDAFAAKYDANGNFLWAKNWGGIGSLNRAVSLFAMQSGILSIVGDFSGSMDIDPGAGTQTVNGAGDAFVLLLNADGSFRGAHTYGTTLAGETAGLVSGNATAFSVVGNFTNPVDFDPSADVVSLTNASGQQQGYLNRYSLLASLPATQPSALVLSNPTGSSIDVSYTASTADGYVVVRRAGAAATAQPKDGQSYFVGDFLTDGVIAYLGPATSFIDANLAANTTYHYQVYAYNNTGGAFNYRTDTPLTDNASTSSITYSRTTDSLALVALYNATNGPGWTNSTNWLAGSIDTWNGVTVLGNRVTKLVLGSNALTGNLPPAIGNFSSLDTLELWGNQLTGVIPVEIGSLTSLRYLDLSPNKFIGSIPPELGNLTLLTTLWINNNLLTGSIPTELGNLTLLQNLYMQGNQLTGTIPPSLGGLGALTLLDISNNQLSGSLPLELGNLSSLTTLTLTANELTGNIPIQLGALSVLQVLQLDQNKFSGSIPPEIGNLTQLQNLKLNTNQLTGSIPTELGNLVNLVYIDLGGNQLSGSVPPTLCSITTLQTLGLARNKLSGSFPTEITNASSLVNLWIDTNQFIGTFPPITSITNPVIDGVTANLNQFDGLPDLSSLNGLLSYMDVTNNNFTFEDLEPNTGVSALSFNPQNPIGQADTLQLNAGDPLNLPYTVGGSANIYEWRLGGVVEAGQVANSLSIPSLTPEDAGRWQLRVTNSLVPGLTLSSAVVLIDVLAEGTFQWLSTGTLAESGINTTTYGGFAGDFNNDGFDDLYTINLDTIGSKLFQSVGDGTFVEVTNSLPAVDGAYSSAWGDYDNDGDLDLFASDVQFAGTPQVDGIPNIFRNEGGGIFTIIPTNMTSVFHGAWGDMDTDGDLDLIAGGNVTYLYRNDGNDTFVQTSPFPNLVTTLVAPLLVVDINGDNRPDLVTQDGSTTKIRVFEQEGNGNFFEQSIFELTESSPIIQPWAISSGDLDNDGDIDLFVKETSTGGTDSYFYWNDGNGFFTAAAASTVIGEVVKGARASTFADVNNDGYLDLIVNTRTTPDTRFFLYLNNGGGSFTKDASQTFAINGNQNGVTIFDFNNDGFLDVYAPNSFALLPNMVYRNKGNSNHFIRLKLEGTTSNRAGVGSNVTIFANGMKQSSYVTSVTGTSSQNSYASLLNFGLGSSTTADSIVVDWPSGYRQVLLNQAADQTLTIVEPPNPISDTDMELIAAYQVQPQDANSYVGIEDFSLDAFDNVLLSGFYTGTVDFDPTVGTVLYTSQADEETYIAKYSTGGGLEWSYVFPRTDTDNNVSHNVVSPDALGGVLVAGRIRGTYDVDPGAGVTSLTSNVTLQADPYFARYDNLGVFSWAKQLLATTSGNDANVDDIITDAAGFILVAGEFGNGTLDMDPSGATATITSSDIDQDIFLGKYDANGNYQWGIKAGTDGDYDYTPSLTTDSQNNIYLSFSIDSEFGQQVIQKYSPAGVLIWSTTNQNVRGSEFRELKLDEGNSRLYVLGNYVGTPTFAGTSGSGTLPTAAFNVDAGCVAVYDLNGAFVNVFGFATTDDCYPVSLSILDDGNVLISGGFEGTADLDPSAGVYESYGSESSFITKITPTGDFVWAATIPKSVGLISELNNQNELTSILIMEQQNVDIEPGPGIFTLSTNSLDFSIVKYDIQGGVLTVDSLALREFYNATGGPNWTTRTNWLSGNISTWFGVTVANDKVTGINLPNNNLSGSVPADALILDDLTTLDFSGNNLSAVPDFSTLPDVTAVNISNNKLDFASLEYNVDVPGIILNNQKEIVIGPDSILIESGSNTTLYATIGGSANTYTWKRNSAVVNTSTADTITIAGVNRDNMGTYQLEIANSIVPGVTLKTVPVNVLAVASLSGKLMMASAVPASAGVARLLRVTSSNGYDTVQIKAVGADGSYAFNNVFLDQYQIVAFADTLVAGQERALPTYYQSTAYWEEADTLFVESSVSGLDILSQLEPPDALQGDGIIAGTVLEDDGAGGRGLGTKRVGGAGVSARRTQGTGRGLEVLELVAYVYTDENGEFSINGLPPNDYRINIQYPGYPMDAESFVDIPVGSTPLDEEVRIEATVADGKITVRQLIVTSLEGADYKADVYPNPAHQQVTISFEETAAGRTVSLMDANGKEIDKRSATGITATLDVRAVPTGLYLVKVRENGKAVKTVRLSVQ